MHDGSKLLDTALQLAAVGTPVFPCLLNKHPATPHGFKDASTDDNIVREWWRACPSALVGVPTGEASGLDVLDLDAKHNTATWWWGENKARVPATRIHRTRSGGLHLLFKHDSQVRSSAGKLALGVDTRGTGGYVIWWAAEFPVLSDAPPAQWPDWLLEEFRPKARAPSASSNPPGFCYHGDAWLKGLVRVVATAVEGQRNGILFWAACRAGEAIREGKTTENFVADVLLEAALHAGLERREALATIQSGVRSE
jgi:Bifunctional DNA primase/polymerase, N-terminal